MPTRRGAQLTARAMTFVALALAVVVIGFLLFSSGSSYHVHMSLVNASQLVKGDPIKVGGVPVGSIDSISLGRDGLAQIDASIDDTGIAPLHQGSRATVRSESLSGVANRYIALTPGPENTAKIADGGTIPAEDTTSEVDLDEVLNTLNASTLGDLRNLVRNSAAARSRTA